jgi:hypothetical protein
MHKMAKMKKFPVSVPLDLHTKFKTKCAAEGVLMTDVVRKLLERECEGTNTKTKPARSIRRTEEEATA